MRRSKFTPEKVSMALRQAESGTAVTEIARKFKSLVAGLSLAKSAVLIGALTLVAAGCNPDVTSPTRLSPSTSMRLDASGTNPSPFHSNSEKYADNASHPVTGRSGSASIVARALLGNDGKTSIEATTGAALDVTSTPPGQIAKVQLKSINGNGDAIRTTNFNGLTAGGYWSTVTEGLGRNAPIQVQSNVRGIDASRTDVVTVKPIVKLRPDLRVESVTNPAKAYVNTSVAISALIREANGDVGATSDCVLLVDGQQVDQAIGMWVDGGSSVSCAFAHTFSALGTHALTVKSVNVVPGDWDLSNNSAAGTIEIVEPKVNLYWNSGAGNHHSGNLLSGTYTGNNCYYFYYCSGFTNQYNYTSDYQSTGFYVYAYTYERAAAFPVNVALTATSDGSPIASMQGSVGSVGNSCYNMYDVVTTTQGTVCSYGNVTATWFERYAGRATYYGNGSQTTFYRYQSYCYNGHDYYYCDRTNSYTYSWSYNYVYNYGGSAPAIGSQVTFGLTLSDANGQKFVAGGSYPVNQHSASDYSYPYCYSYTYWYIYTDCGISSQFYRQTYGGAWGYGQQ